MKLNFKRIASVITGAVMLTSTAALAAATANTFPDPFVKSGSADVAVVYGSQAKLLGTTDVQAALTVAEKVNNYVVAASVTPQSTVVANTTGDGDVYNLEKTSTKFHIGNGALDVVSGTIKDDNLPTLLASGKYVDENNDEFDYDQKISLANFTVSMFDDNDYAADTPTVGVRVASGAPLLNYSLDFTDAPNMTDLETTDLPMMGRSYYVLDVTGTTKITLLDSAESVVLKEGETKTVTVNGKPYELSISFINTNSVKLKVNDQVTNSLRNAQTYKLKDGAYIGIKDISVQDYAGGSKQVEFGIGAGKLILTNGQDVELNENTVNRLKAYIDTTSGDLLSKITLEWKADGDQFAADNSSIVMPGFNAVKVGFAGVNYPKTENIQVEKGGDDYFVLKDFPLKDGTETINLAFSGDTSAKNLTGIGKDTDQKLLVGDRNVTFTDGSDEYFVASWTDGKDAESYLVKAESFGTTGTAGENKTTLAYLKDGTWTRKEGMKDGDTWSIGSVDLKVGKLNYEGKTAVILADNANTNFNTLYSKEGMKVILPWINTTAVNLGIVDQYTAATACSTGLDTVNTGAGQIGDNQVITYNSSATDLVTTVTCTSYPTTVLQLFEKDKDGDIAAGKNINLTLGFNSASTPQVSVTDVVGENSGTEQIGGSDVYRAFTYSDLASEILWDKSADQYSVNVVNHGGETTAKVFVSSPTVTVGTSDSGAINTNIPQLLDTEVATKAADKNLIVVGGSCINTVAAKLLGSDTPLCGDDFTKATQTKVGKDVTSGSYLVSTFASPYNANKVAMLVAGYEAAETMQAASYLSANVTTAKGDTFVNGAKVTVSGQ